MKAKPTLRSVLAKNLKATLVRRKKSVVTVADFAEVSAAHLYDIIGCRKAATVDVIDKLAAALGVEPAELLGEREAELTTPLPGRAGKRNEGARPGASGRSSGRRGRAGGSRS